MPNTRISMKEGKNYNNNTENKWVKEEQGVGRNCFFTKHKKVNLLDGCEGWIQLNNKPAK